MNRLLTGLLALLLLAACVFCWLQYRAQETLQVQISALAGENARLNANAENLSNLVAQANSGQAISKEQLNELLKLRGEVGTLRHQTNQLGRVREENQRLQAALQNTKPEPASSDAIEQQRQVVMQKMSDAKQGILAFIMFAEDNHSQYPTNFTAASKYAKDDFMSQVETNFDLVYQGSTTGITNPSETIVVREKQAWQSVEGKWMKIYGFADGHVETHTEPDGKFDDWENQRIVQQPPPNQ